MMRRIHHVGIVVERLATAYRFYRDTLGLPLLKEAVIAEQGVRAALLAAGDSEVELLEPLDASSGVGKFLARRGEGLHHLCLDTADIEGALAGLAARGVELIDAAPRPGLAGRIAFLHPRACAGVLVELATPPAAPAVQAPAPLRLTRVVLGARDPGALAARFRALFGLEALPLDPGPRALLAVGRGALLVVPAEEVGGAEGLVALSMAAGDLAGLGQALGRAGIAALRGPGGLTLEPAHTHGVPLQVSRFE